MYQITYDHYILYDPRFATAEDKLMITEPDVYLAVGKAGEMSFVLQPDHPYLDRLQRMQGVVSLLDDGVPVYRGRITKDNATYYGSRKITTEGLMACLNDSVMPPFSFPGDVEEDEEYQTAAASGNVVEYFFRWVLTRHNAQVSEAQQIKPGVCTVTDSNNYIARSSTEYLPTMEVLTTRLPKSALGGHLLIRYEADGNYLDYCADLPLTNTQRVEYAANLLDIVSERDGTEIYTSILPVGKDGLTIADIADGDLTDDLVKDGLTVYSRSGVAAYGRINRYVRWDDVTVVANLLAKAKASVSSAGLATQEGIAVQAVDLGWQDSVQHFRVGRMTLLVSTPHGYNAAYALMELQPDILSPGNTRITLGATRQTYTGAQIDTDRETKEDMDRQREEIKSEMREETRQQLNQVTESTTQQITDVQQSLNSIILAALQNYVETGEFGSYKEEMSSKLELLANQLNLTLTTITERIEDVNGDLQSKYSEVTKAFRFTADGLIIGESGNEILLRLDNDVMQFIRNNTPELMLTAAGVEAHQVKVTILIIGNVAFMADGSGDVVVKGVK
ncbi:MAG: phage tail protein [Oscillospiraceae bacterium]|nr:phage tail protein [Oscillospiraceae bacterium]